MIRLLRMRAEAFSGFIKQAIESSLDDIEGLNRWPKAESLELAQSEVKRLLPQGLSTPNNIFLEIVENDNELAIGFIWVSLGSRGSEQIAFIHQLFIYPQHRRQGHARATLEAIEAALLARGGCSHCLARVQLQQDSSAALCNSWIRSGQSEPAEKIGTTSLLKRWLSGRSNLLTSRHVQKFPV